MDGSEKQVTKSAIFEKIKNADFEANFVVPCERKSLKKRSSILKPPRDSLPNVAADTETIKQLRRVSFAKTLQVLEFKSNPSNGNVEDYPKENHEDNWNSKTDVLPKLNAKSSKVVALSHSYCAMETEETSKTIERVLLNASTVSSFTLQEHNFSETDSSSASTGSLPSFKSQFEDSSKLLGEGASINDKFSTGIDIFDPRFLEVDQDELDIGSNCYVSLEHEKDAKFSEAIHNEISMDLTLGITGSKPVAQSTEILRENQSEDVSSKELINSFHPSLLNVQNDYVFTDELEIGSNCYVSIEDENAKFADTIHNFDTSIDLTCVVTKDKCNNLNPGLTSTEMFHKPLNKTAIFDETMNVDTSLCTGVPIGKILGEVYNADYIETDMMVAQQTCNDMVDLTCLNMSNEDEKTNAIDSEVPNAFTDLKNVLMQQCKGTVCDTSMELTCAPMANGVNFVPKIFNDENTQFFNKTIDIDTGESKQTETRTTNVTLYHGETMDDTKCQPIGNIESWDTLTREVLQERMNISVQNIERDKTSCAMDITNVQNIERADISSAMDITNVQKIKRDHISSAIDITSVQNSITIDKSCEIEKMDMTREMLKEVINLTQCFNDGEKSLHPEVRLYDETMDLTCKSKLKRNFGNYSPEHRTLVSDEIRFFYDPIVADTSFKQNSGNSRANCTRNRENFEIMEMNEILKELPNNASPNPSIPEIDELQFVKPVNQAKVFDETLVIDQSLCFDKEMQRTEMTNNVVVAPLRAIENIHKSTIDRLPQVDKTKLFFETISLDSLCPNLNHYNQAEILDSSSKRNEELPLKTDNREKIKEPFCADGNEIVKFAKFQSTNNIDSTFLCVDNDFVKRNEKLQIDRTQFFHETIVATDESICRPMSYSEIAKPRVDSSKSNNTFERTRFLNETMEQGSVCADVNRLDLEMEIQPNTADVSAHQKSPEHVEDMNYANPLDEPAQQTCINEGTSSDIFNCRSLQKKERDAIVQSGIGYLPHLDGPGWDSIRKQTVSSLSKSAKNRKLGTVQIKAVRSLEQSFNPQQSKQTVDAPFIETVDTVVSQKVMNEKQNDSQKTTGKLKVKTRSKFTPNIDVLYKIKEMRKRKKDESFSGTSTTFPTVCDSKIQLAAPNSASTNDYFEFRLPKAPKWHKVEKKKTSDDDDVLSGGSSQLPSIAISSTISDGSLQILTDSVLDDNSLVPHSPTIQATLAADIPAVVEQQENNATPENLKESNTPTRNLSSQFLTVTNTTSGLVSVGVQCEILTPEKTCFHKTEDAFFGVSPELPIQSNIRKNCATEIEDSCAISPSGTVVNESPVSGKEKLEVPQTILDVEAMDSHPVEDNPENRNDFAEQNCVASAVETFAPNCETQRELDAQETVFVEKSNIDSISKSFTILKVTSKEQVGPAEEPLKESIDIEEENYVVKNVEILNEPIAETKKLEESQCNENVASVSIENMLEPVIQATQKKFTKWKIVSISDSLLTVSFVWGTVIVYISFDESLPNPLVKRITSVTFESKLYSKSNEIVKVAHMLFHKAIEVCDFVLEYPDTSHALPLLRCLSSAAKIAELLLYDIDLVTLRHKTELKSDTEFSVRVINLNLMSMFWLTFPLGDLCYPKILIVPRIDKIELGKKNISIELLQNSLSKIEPGEFYLRRMVVQAEEME